MNIILRVIQLVITCAIGFYGYLVVIMYAFSPKLFGNEVLIENHTIFFGGGLWACLLGLTIGLGSFFLEDNKRLWCLMAPIYIPLFYLLAIGTYYAT
jgi:hypothetical protein